ncbi:hypothetical protein C0966_15320 [Bacillus methanolicus]|uniref:hypothetical protein n=1 Tax=Bacillus methanolicus TaxID=1471 RepID=UPI002380A370|nr:hypothetical protein [Bacillus methanolicus]MDE3840670.1 hypothetical protein [Bacillus methanolicus]
MDVVIVGAAVLTFSLMCFYCPLFINGLRKKKRKLPINGLQKRKRMLPGKRVKYSLKHFYFISIVFISFLLLTFIDNLLFGMPFGHLNHWLIMEIGAYLVLSSLYFLSFIFGDITDPLPLSSFWSFFFDGMGGGDASVSDSSDGGDGGGGGD